MTKISRAAIIEATKALGFDPEDTTHMEIDTDKVTVRQVFYIEGDRVDGNEAASILRSAGVSDTEMQQAVEGSLRLATNI